MITILISNINKRQTDVNNIHSGEVRAAKSALEKPEDNSLQVSIKTSDFFLFVTICHYFCNKNLVKTYKPGYPMFHNTSSKPTHSSKVLKLERNFQSNVCFQKISFRNVLIFHQSYVTTFETQGDY